MMEPPESLSQLPDERMAADGEHSKALSEADSENVAAQVRAKAPSIEASADVVGASAKDDLPVWISRYKEIEGLQHAWQTEFEKRASGGAIALSGFHYQFMVALHDTLRAWLARPPFERTRPKVLTECLSDILEKSSNNIILVTQVKRTIRSDSFHDALTELWLINDLALKTVPNLVPYLRFRILSSKTELQDLERAVSKWSPAEQFSSDVELESFRNRVAVQLFSDPEDEVLSLLANNLRATDPTGYVQQWLGQLIAAASRGGAVWFEAAAQSIWNDLQSIENSSVTTSPSIYIWTSQDRAPENIVEGNVLIGERPQVHHLRQGYFASRASAYNPIVVEAQKWIGDLTENQDKQLRLPVFWIGGRSGSGKSVALMHVLALLHESGFGSILWLGNKTELLRQAVPWALKLRAQNRQVIIGIDDPYAPNTQNDDLIWREALAVLESVRQGGDASALPLIMCCGPTEQAERMRKDLPEEVIVNLRELPKEDQEDIFQLRSWYIRRTKKSPPKVGDENVLLVQLFFEWETGQPLPAFASRFRNRIKESDLNGTLEDLITRMLCANRLYVGYPNMAVVQHLTPSQQDTFRRLREEHHIAQNASDYGVGLWLAHPHLSNVIYESWYPLHSNRAVRTNHLRLIINDSFKFGTSPNERTAPLWAISQAVSLLQEEKLLPVVGRLDRETIIDLLPAVYKSRTQDYGEGLTLTELPVWIQLRALLPELVLQPDPVSEALNQIKVEHLEEKGLRLTCHKLLQHFNSLPEYHQPKIIESMIQLLTQAPQWHQWALVMDHAYRQTKDPRLTNIIIDWVRNHLNWRWADRLFASVCKDNPSDPQILKEAQALLPRVGGAVGWGDIAIQLTENPRSEIPTPVAQWAKNNHQEWASCFLLAHLLRRGFTPAIEWAWSWCERWHTERSANFVLESLLTLIGSNTDLKDWCLRWIATDHRKVDNGFIVEKMIKTFPADIEVLSMGIRWLENNDADHGSWHFVWQALYLSEPGNGFGNDASVPSITQKLTELMADNSKGWYYLAITLGKSLRREEQITALIKATESDPQFVEAWHALKVTYNQLGQTERALEASLKLTELRPDDPEAWYYLGIAYGKLEQYREEVTALTKATELNPDFYEAWQALGAAYDRLGLNDLAIIATSKSTSLDPNNSENWYYLSVSYSKAGRSEDRIVALRKAADLEPTHVKVWQALSSAHAELGQYHNAIDAALKVTALAPDSAEAWQGLGIIYGKLERHQDEVSALVKAITLDPYKLQAWRALGAVYNILGKNELALEAATKVVALRPNDAEAWYRLGVSYGKVGLLDNKIAALIKATELSPTFVEAWGALSTAHSQLGDNEFGITALQKVTESTPDSAKAWYHLGIIYGLSDRYENAVAALTRATELDPNYAAAWQTLGATHNRQEQYELALAAATKVVELRPDDAEAWYRLGIAYGKVGRLEDKVAALKKAGSINPDLMNVYGALSDTHYSQAEINQLALEFSLKRIELMPENSEAWYYLGISYGKLGRYEDEAVALSKATKLDPDSAEAWLALGATYNELGQNELAKHASIKLTQLRPDDAEAWYWLGVTYGKLNCHSDKAVALEKALELKPDFAEAVQALGATYNHLRQYDRGLGAALRLTELTPHDAEAWYYLGLAYGKLDRYQNEVEALVRATELEPSYAAAWYALGATYNHLGQYELALAATTKVTKLKPDDADAWYRLGLSYFKVKRFEDASTALTEAIKLDPSMAKAQRKLSDVNAILGKYIHGTNVAVTGLDTSDAKQWYDLGVTYTKADDLEQAASAFQQSIKSATDENVAALTILQLLITAAATAYQDDNYDEAVNLCKAVIKMEPAIPEIWRILGSSYRRQGAHEHALDSAKHLVSISSHSAEAWYILGLRYKQLDCVKDAITAFECALQLDPNFSAAQRELNKLTD